MKAHGPGLEGGLVGKPAEFTIDTKGAGTGGLGLTVEGPCEAKIECSDNGDGTCSVSYLPTKPGEYFVNILFEEVHIPGSPFKADIEMPFDPSKVVASGPGLEHGKAGEAGLLTVDCSEAGPGTLGLEAVSDSGAKAEVSIQNNKDGTYAVTYVPLTAGMYTLTMKYGGELVPHFPTRVKVEPAVDTSGIKAFGPGIEGKGESPEQTPLPAGGQVLTYSLCLVWLTNWGERNNKGKWGSHCLQRLHSTKSPFFCFSLVDWG